MSQAWSNLKLKPSTQKLMRRIRVNRELNLGSGATRGTAARKKLAQTYRSMRTHWGNRRTPLHVF